MKIKSSLLISTQLIVQVFFRAEIFYVRQKLARFGEMGVKCKMLFPAPP